MKGRLQPLPLLALAFGTGIAFSGLSLPPARVLFASVLAGVVVALAALRAAPRLALATLCALSLAAGAFTEAASRERHPNALARWTHRRVTLVGHILQEPRNTCTGRWVYRAHVSEVRHRGEATVVDAFVLLRTDAPHPLPAGSLFEASGFLRPISGLANFGTVNYPQRLAYQHLFMELNVWGPFLRRVARAPVRWDRQLAWRLRERLVRVHQKALPPKDAALLNSLVFGSRAADLPEALEREFQEAGITHVLVASGAQVSLLVLCLLPALRWIWVPRWLYGLFAFAAAWLYGLMAGGGPSILRAGAMSTAMVVAHSLGRPTDWLSLLALAGMGILVLNPPALFDVGFQLSFAAVWGLITWGPVLTRWLPARPRWFWQILAASTAAQLATAPLIAHTFCRAAPVGVLTNLVAVPLAGVLLAGGLATSFVGLVSPTLAWMLDTLLLPLLWALHGAARLGAALPGGHFWVVPPVRLQVVVTFALLAALPGAIRTWRAMAKPFWIPARHYQPGLALGLLLALPLANWRLPPTKSLLRVTFLDVGHGDSILVQAPSGTTLLVDGGGGAPAECRFAERVLIPAILRRGVRRLDYVVSTHPHPDHIDGLIGVCHELQVGSLICSGLYTRGPKMGELLREAQRRHIPVVRVRLGDSWWLDDRTRVTVLNPPEGAPDVFGIDAENENSLVLRVEFGGVSFLLTGDVGSATEAALLASGALLPATVLKVAHHGSETSSSEDFLQAVAPRVAVISVGQEERFRLPHPRVVKRLLAKSALLMRTDEEGAIEVRTNGEWLQVRSARGNGGLVTFR